MSATEKNTLVPENSQLETTVLKRECNALSRALLLEKQRADLLETLLEDCRTGKEDKVSVETEN